jgi:hypothetical protein
MIHRMHCQRLISDGVMHRVFDPDGDGLVLVCELAARDVKYKDLRRFTFVELIESTHTTCLGCLSAGSADDDEKTLDDVFNKRMEDV